MSRSYEFYVIVAPVEPGPPEGRRFVGRAEVFEVIDGSRHRMDEPSAAEVQGTTPDEAREQATARAQAWIAARKDAPDV